MLRAGISQVAMRYNFDVAGAPGQLFYVIPEPSADGARYRFVCFAPQYELAPLCEQVLRFLARAMDFPGVLSLEYRFDLTGSVNAGHLDRWYDDHKAAGLDEASVLSTRYVGSSGDVRDVFEQFIHDRRTMKERYLDTNLYLPIAELRVTVETVGASAVFTAAGKEA